MSYPHLKRPGRRGKNAKRSCSEAYLKNRFRRECHPKETAHKGNVRALARGVSSSGRPVFLQKEEEHSTQKKGGKKQIKSKGILGLWTA